MLVVGVAHVLERAIVSFHAFLNQSDLPSTVLTILAIDAGGICNLFVTLSPPCRKASSSLYYYFQQSKFNHNFRVVGIFFADHSSWVKFI